ncbi:hypothetical protein IKT18_01200 [Candidatus Saccharibacteria bacterium]|nr:hypothetical protein [Candidatus Saccharibacteria bacterium]
MANNETIQSQDGSSPWLKEGLFNGVQFASDKSKTESTAEDAIGDLPTTSVDPTCQSYLQIINRRGKMESVKDYLSKMLTSQPKTYASADDFEKDNPDYFEIIDKTLPYSEQKALQEYSGTRFAWINSVARGIWDYDKLGRKTPELESHIKSTIQEISSAIEKAPAPKEDFVTFRGTNLDGFRNYGVRSISDLSKLQGQFMLEKGFTSTAIERDKSFADRDVSTLWIGTSNIRVNYHIPSGSRTGVALLSDDLSYSAGQTEYLINRNSLVYVSNIMFDKENHATIDAVVIPQDVYEDGAPR